jgi:peptidoglycan/xylan/chitin deacetylase (PgdA/CDA1 family)
MSRVKLGVLVGIISIGIVSLNLSYGKDNKLITESLALENEESTEENIATEEIKKDDDIVSKGNIIYSAKDYSVKASDVSKILENPYIGDEKQIFLTFDDGPSENTDKVVKILKNEGVYGTFFVLGDSLEAEDSDKRLINTIKSGNALANHTYSHDYKKLYTNGHVNIDAFIGEILKTNEMMKNILGTDFECNVIRLPGGYMTREYYKDKNLKALDDVLRSKGLIQLDWTSENGDGVTKKESLEKMLLRVYEQTEEQKNIVLLMHDSKGKELTLEALPYIINHFKEKGFIFKVIANDNI